MKEIFIIISILLLMWVFDKTPIGWRFHFEGDVAQDYIYPDDFIDKEVLKYHPDNFLNYWEARGVKDWVRIERIYLEEYIKK